MATVIVKHATKTNAAADPLALVDGPTWDNDAHVITGLENVVNVDTTNASNITSGTLPAARLPVPTASTLGGVESLANVSHKWINSIGTDGVPTQTQPAFTDISGSVAASQMPALTGDVTTSAGAVATTLATVNSNVGTFGSATQASQVTVNAKGLTTAAASVTITPAVGSVTGLGTGVATALAVNIGTAGAPVVNGGALGTPSSGVATNLTGTAASLTAGTVTTNANLTGAVTSVGNATSLGSFTSANLKAALTDETGSGAAVFATSPALVTPTGIVKGDVGLGNVDNTSDASKNSASVTLTNKTLDNTNTVTLKDTLFTLQDDGDTTKQARFQLSGITTGTTRTYTFIDASDFIVLRDANMTVTTKTFDTATNTFKVNGSAINFLGVPAPQGRLTLLTAAPVMTSTQSAKTTLFYTPYIGNSVPVYDGTNMVATSFSELSIALSDTTKNPAAIGASKVNDWFVWNDAGTIRLSHGPDWTSDTARSAGTALVMVNGILLNNASITNGPAASRGTYVGTTRSNASSQLDWIVGGSASGGTAGFFGVWNNYNRTNVSTTVFDTGTGYTYTSATIRQARASAGNQISFVVGQAEDGFTATMVGQANTVAVAGATALWGIGLNSTSAFAAGRTFGQAATANATVFGSSATANLTPQLGLNVISANESSDGANANTFDNNSLNNLSATLRI